MNNILKFVIFFFLILNFTFFIFHSSIAYAIEVGGHLTEDTTWSPNNNPYLVTETLYVDAGVTLTILPGTEIKVSGAPCTHWGEQWQNFWLINGVSIAKMLWVDGKINAEGTEQDSITFSRLQDDNEYYWGCIYLSPQSEMSRFKHCNFEYSAGIGFAAGNVAEAAVSIYNGKGLIQYCKFLNNGGTIITRDSLVRNLEITHNIFIIDSNIIDFIINLWGADLSISEPFIDFKSALVAGNEFINTYISTSSMYYVDNLNNSTDISEGSSDFVTYFFDNTFINCYRSIHGGCEQADDSFYIKNNQFIGGHAGIDVNYVYVEICDNYFEDCDLWAIYDTGKICNNIINEAELTAIGEYEIFDNILSNGITGIAINQIVSNNNNISINNEYAFGGYFNGVYNNCILVSNNEITQYGVSGNPIFRNCILDFELPPECIDGGGNIIVDSLQAQSIFEDIQNGDFHLAPGSIAIDAGFDTLSYYYPFDMDYNHRVWDGDNNGTVIIDIGPYEYGAPSFGGIEGFTYDPVNGEAVDYVLLKVNNEPGEFTFSDNSGHYEIKLPAGVYDVYAERVFYDNVIEFQIEVIDGENTQLYIPMTATVDIDENEIVPVTKDFNLTNYPNPFNPETTISFSVTQNYDFVNLEVYNIKGQRVTTLINEPMQSGKHTAIWSGLDSNNKPVSSGIYLYKIKAVNQESVKRMLLLK